MMGKANSDPLVAPKCFFSPPTKKRSCMATCSLWIIPCCQIVVLTALLLFCPIRKEQGGWGIVVCYTLWDGLNVTDIVIKRICGNHDCPSWSINLELVEVKKQQEKFFKWNLYCFTRLITENDFGGHAVKNLHCMIPKASNWDWLKIDNNESIIQLINHVPWQQLMWKLLFLLLSLIVFDRRLQRVHSVLCKADPPWKRAKIKIILGKLNPILWFCNLTVKHSWMLMPPFGG